ncbi:hypothetical protein MBRA1_003934 [Malassezia brasiliensis]|uniref:Uncharacterized protein n=1 Tax=Malassezia brasiliensis TaxID=1821822 RepID=A0AAF0DXL9_9BASI|nr:hypothetical protein MBRA1_003934 [Malassezia brasiliensis]
MERRGVRRYALLAARAAARAVPGAARAEPEAGAWWAHWTAPERARFFRALAVHSRLRPDCIAEDVGRPVEEVARVLRVFRRLARRTRRLEQRRGDRRSALALYPAAHQLSADWIRFEEAAADALADADDRLTCAQPLDAPAAVAAFLRGSGTEPLVAIVDRLVDVRPPLAPTPAYAAFAHTQPLPALASLDDVAQVLEAMLAQGRLVAPADLARPLEASALRSTAPMTWPEAREEAVLDADALAAWLARHSHGAAAPYLAPGMPDVLTRVLRSFVTRVLYEVITVGERAMPPASVDAQHVWAAVARLGGVQAHELNADMAEAVQEQRIWAEPPVAWMHPVPSEARGRTVPIDVALSSEGEESESEGSEGSGEEGSGEEGSGAEGSTASSVSGFGRE